MDEALAAVADELRHVHKAHLSHYATHPKHVAVTKECLNKVDKLNLVLSSISPSARKAFIKNDANAIILCRTYTTFLGIMAEIYYGKTFIANHRSIVDRLFNTLNVKPAKHFNYLPTRIFTQFCKGITYFAGEDITERPFYHRPASCGTRALAVDQKFIVPKDATPAQLQAIHRATRLCYMERMIYDKIFTELLHYQDIGHVGELRRMERLYQDYYGDVSIDIQVRFIDELPIALEVITQRNRTFVTESYTKQIWNDNEVLCTKRMYANKERDWYKRQGFDKEMPWIPMIEPKKDVRSASLPGMDKTSFVRRQAISLGGKNR